MFYVDSSLINIKLISRIKEDVVYRVYGQPHSSITVAGVAYNFNKYGHNFLVLDAKTGLERRFIKIDATAL